MEGELRMELLEQIAPGLLALAGVFVGYFVQLASSHADRKERRHRLNREKFEEVCRCIQESTVEMQTFLGSQGEEALRFNPTAASNAHYLCLIYFPELADVTRDYSNMAAIFRSSLYGSGFRLDVNASIGAQSAINDPDYPKRLEQLQLQRAVVEGLIEELASKYVKA